MKVLLINNFYYNRGGDCTYMFSLKSLLESHGHKVIIFSMKHPKNFDSEYSKYFVSHIDYVDELSSNKLYSAIRVLKKAIFSFEAKRKIEELIKDEKPDIAHINNIHHHITPSIIYSLKKNKIPIVWTLHDYTIICPNTSFLAGDKICEKCRKRKYYWPLLTRCKKNSFGASAVAALETIIHRLFGVYNLVDVFIAPSSFLKNKFIEYGFNKNKLVKLNHALSLNMQISNDEVQPDDYYLFVGRLTEEKGIRILIDAALEVNSSKLKIIGEGPLLDEIVNYVNERDKNKLIEILGRKSSADLLEYYKKCKFIVVPSTWYENAGLIIFEAYACGKPVIGSGIGGIPEFVRNLESGLIVTPGNKDSLVRAIKHLLNYPDLTATLGKNGRRYLLEKHGLEEHYQGIMKIYKRALSTVN